MQRIRTVLQKLTELAQRNPDRSIIEIDLMLDYTRVIYADLLEQRAGIAGKTQLNIQEPTLDEMTAAMAVQEEEEEDQIVFPEPVMPVAPLPVKEEAPAPVTVQAPVLPQPVAAMPKPLAPLPPLPPPPARPAKDIREYIDLNDKYLFLSELFQNDMRTYEDTMKALNQCSNRQEALQLLGTAFLNEQNPAYSSFQYVIDRFFE